MKVEKVYGKTGRPVEMISIKEIDIEDWRTMLVTVRNFEQKKVSWTFKKPSEENSSLKMTTCLPQLLSCAEYGEMLTRW